MASMTDITVKKSDGVTNIVWTALTPSAGDSVPAQWRSETVSTQVNGKPTATLMSKYNKERTVRRIESQIRYPQTSTDSTTGLIAVVNSVPVSISAAVPTGVPDAVVAEAIAQAANLLASALFQTSFKSGYAPT